MPGFPVLYHPLEFAQTHVHWVDDAIHPSHPLLSASPPALKSFPALGSFPVSQLFASGGQSIGASASAPVLPMNIQGWFALGLTGLISLFPGDSQESSPATQLESISCFFKLPKSQVYVCLYKYVWVSVYILYACIYSVYVYYIYIYICMYIYLNVYVYLNITFIMSPYCLVSNPFHSSWPLWYLHFQALLEKMLSVPPISLGSRWMWNHYSLAGHLPMVL